MTIELTGKLVLLGAGKMGGAMLQGWIAGGLDPALVAVLDPAPPSEVAALIAEHGIAHNPSVETIGGVEVLIAAVKPQIMDEALQTVLPLGASKPLVLSVAAGRTIASFEAHFGKDAAVIRSIPNTPAAIGRGITAISSNANVSSAQLALACQLLSSIGEVVTVDDETLIDAVTAVSGSGPAYIFYLTECLDAAGRAAGLPDELATKLARATVSGAAELMHQSGIDAATLRENVTSPKGTTAEALGILMADDGLEPLMRDAVAAATRRSRELAT